MLSLLGPYTLRHAHTCTKTTHRHARTQLCITRTTTKGTRDTNTHHHHYNGSITSRNRDALETAVPSCRNLHMHTHALNLLIFIKRIPIKNKFTIILSSLLFLILSILYLYNMNRHVSNTGSNAYTGSQKRKM